MSLQHRLMYRLFALTFFICAPDSFAATSVNPKPLTGKTSHVRISQHQGQHQLLVNDTPFYVKGAGLEFGNQEQLAFYGGNSFRTWQTNNGKESGRSVLDRAQRNGLFVTFGIDMASERSGFNYDDPEAVAKQFQRIKSEVIEYKNHPALLMWAIGNELNLGTSNPKVWDAVNEVAQMIHQLDSNHPVMTNLAGFDPELIELIKTRAGALDLIGIQLYGDIANIKQKLHNSSWQGAYIVTEWGPTGHWEVPQTDWGAPIEDNSSQKAAALAQRYAHYIRSDEQQCLGSYVFLWGQKQERTPTWYSMFLDSGETTEAVDVMSYHWTGKWPANRSPSIASLNINSQVASNNIRLLAGQQYQARIDAEDADQDQLSFRWQIMSESDAKNIGGDHENTPSVITTDMLDLGNGNMQFNAPKTTGNFRLFVYVYDGKGSAAHANIPFQVVHVVK